MDLKETIRILELVNKINITETMNHHDYHEVQFKTERAIDSAISILKEKLENEENLIKQLEEWNKLPPTLVLEEPKITLRDHFAGLAMQTLVTQRQASFPETTVNIAYEIADKMIEVRNKTK